MKEAASTENEVLAPQLDELADEIAQFLCLRAKILPIDPVELFVLAIGIVVALCVRPISSPASSMGVPGQQ